MRSLNVSDDLMLETLDKLQQTLPGDDATEFWFARDIQEALNYSKWENFQNVLKKAIASCEEAGDPVEAHFRRIDRAITMPNGGERITDDFMLTRYAAYLIAMNGDPRKKAVAYSQSYFAVQTRKHEIIEARMQLQERIDARDRLKESEKSLNALMYERGVDSKGFGIIRSKGDAALFGGLNTQAMKTKYGITGSRPLADFLPTLSIAAKNLANEMTNINVVRDDHLGEYAIGKEHVDNNKSVREILGQRGIRPEELSAEPDLAALERQVNKEAKSITKTRLPPAIEE